MALTRLPSNRSPSFLVVNLTASFDLGCSFWSLIKRVQKRRCGDPGSMICVHLVRSCIYQTAALHRRSLCKTCVSNADTFKFSSAKESIFPRSFPTLYLLSFSFFFLPLIHLTSIVFPLCFLTQVSCAIQQQEHTTVPLTCLPPPRLWTRPQVIIPLKWQTSRPRPTLCNHNNLHSLWMLTLPLQKMSTTNTQIRPWICFYNK